MVQSQTYNMPQDKVDEFLKDHHPSTVVHRYKNKDALKEHPHVQDFLEWKKKVKVRVI